MSIMSAEVSKNNQPTQTKPVMVVYHADCIDGAASAYILAKSMGIQSPGRSKYMTFIPYEHSCFEKDQQTILNSLKDNMDIFFLDVAPRKDFLNELIALNETGYAKIKSITVFDHHNTTTRTLMPYKEYFENIPSLKIKLKIESNELSAAKIVWNEKMAGKQCPDYLKIVNLMDKSNLRTRDEFAAAAYIDTHKITTPRDALKTLSTIAKMTFNTMAERGRPVADHQKTLIDNLFTKTRLAEIEILPGQTIKVPIVNADVKNFGRQISNRLVELGRQYDAGVAFAWFEQKNGAVTLSIRTNGEPDAGQIANHMRKTMDATGGGHKDLAAVHFSSLQEFVKHIDSKTEAAEEKPENNENSYPKTVVKCAGNPNKYMLHA